MESPGQYWQKQSSPLRHDSRPARQSVQAWVRSRQSRGSIMSRLPACDSNGLRNSIWPLPEVLHWINVTPAAGNQMLVKIRAAREALDAWTREVIQWHFSPDTGCPFWLEYARKLDWDPRRE